MPSPSSPHSLPPADGISRRGFLKSLGATAASLGAARSVNGAGTDDAERWQGPGPVPVVLRVNGREMSLNLEPRVTLLEALRVHLGLTGAKEACDRASCGACTVLLDELPVNACSLLAIEAQGCEITTIEGLVAEATAQQAGGLPLTPLQEALVTHDGLQCGFCTPGFVMVLTALLRRNPRPTEAEVREACAGNLCRCGSYPRIFAAVLAASGRPQPSRFTVMSMEEIRDALA